MRIEARFEFLALMFVFLLSTSALVYADRGMIPIQPEVSIYEPGQKAIIAWDGKEEILIVSTDVHSDNESLVVELLPLPSKPNKVELASFKSFEKINEIIWNVGFKTYGERGGFLHVEDGVELFFHEKIGAHNIAIVKAEDSSKLASWMTNFLRENGVAQDFSLQGFKPVVDNYMARGFQYYVLDLITASPEQKSVEPILYWFNTSFLYYPLEISSPVNGNTRVTLFLFTKGTIEEDPQPFRLAGYQTSNGWKPIRIWLSNGELSKIDLRIGELLKDGAWMCALNYDGELHALTDDLIITEEAFTPANSTNIPLEIIIVLSAILGAACTLAGVVVTYLIMRSKTEEKRRKT